MARFKVATVDGYEIVVEHQSETPEDFAAAIKDRKTIETTKIKGGTAMAWFFESTGAEIRLHISENGVLYATGNGRHNFTAQTGDHRILTRLSRVNESAWSLHKPIKDELHSDGLGRGLWGFFESLHGRSAGMIEYYPASGSADEIIVGVAIFPEPAATEAFDLLKMAIGKPDWRILLSFDFLGFREEGAKSQYPTATEFVRDDMIARRVFFADGVSLSLNPGS
jgi:hypothetical protein